jgi:hypothetical protein
MRARTTPMMSAHRARLMGMARDQARRLKSQTSSVESAPPLATLMRYCVPSGL